MRVRLEGHKKPLRIHTSESKYTLAEANMHHFLLVHIRNGLMCIRNGFLMTLKSDSHY